jgi:hypothetical protein
MESRAFAPAKGDVLFFYGPGIGSKASGFIQLEIDPAAQTANLVFDHVAIAITDLLALEAVPAPSISKGMEVRFEDPHAVELAEWSRVELRAGVRLVPIPDLLVPTLNTGGRLNVLRYPKVERAKLDEFDYTKPEIARLIGSAYSVDILQEEAEHRFGAALTDLVASKMQLSSLPNDVATKLGLTDELLLQMKEELPQYVVPAAARTFFCSKLVVFCLELSRILSKQRQSELTTPTGLYRILVEDRWHDVTEDHYAKAAIDEYSNRSPSLYRSSYYSALSLASLAAKQLIAGEHLDLTRALQDKGIKFFDKLAERLQRERKE